MTSYWGIHPTPCSPHSQVVGSPVSVILGWSPSRYYRVEPCRLRAVLHRPQTWPPVPSLTKSCSWCHHLDRAHPRQVYMAAQWQNVGLGWTGHWWCWYCLPEVLRPSWLPVCPPLEWAGEQESSRRGQGERHEPGRPPVLEKCPVLD